MSGWYIVKFINEEDLIEAVPSNWVLDNKQECLWPPYTRGNLLTAIKTRETPNIRWDTHKINMVTDKLYLKFITASAKATKAKFSSDISSGTESMLEKRKSRPSKRYLDSSSSSNEESDTNLPEFPVVPTKKIRESSSKEIKEATSFFENIQDQSNTPIMPHQSCSYSEPLITTLDQDNYSTTPPPQSISSRPTAKTSSKTNLAVKPCDAGSSTLFSTPRSSMPMVATSTLNQSTIIDEEWKQQAMRYLVVISNRLKEQNKLFDYIINYIESDNRNANQPNNSNSDILKFFPVTDDNKIEEIDLLLQEENNFNALVTTMTRAGGDNASEIVRRIMTRLLINEVAVLYSWHGHKGKKKFASLKLASVVYEAAKKNKNASLITEKEVEIIGARWLTKALDRMKKRA